jgi:hypothetical protein
MTSKRKKEGAVSVYKYRERKETESHGYSGTKVYNVWRCMLQRCYYPEHGAYKIYGGRGITVCDKWRDSFLCFLKDMGEPPDGMSLDREDVNREYSKENCKWATREEQANNRRSNTFVEFNGKRMTLAQWSRELGISVGAVLRRVAKGLPLTFGKMKVGRKRAL